MPLPHSVSGYTNPAVSARMQKGLHPRHARVLALQNTPPCLLLGSHVSPPDCTVSRCPDSTRGYYRQHLRILALEMQAARPIPTVMDTKTLDVHRPRGTRSNYIQGTNAVQPHQANHPHRAPSPTQKTHERGQEQEKQIPGRFSHILNTWYIPWHNFNTTPVQLRLHT